MDFSNLKGLKLNRAGLANIQPTISFDEPVLDWTNISGIGNTMDLPGLANIQPGIKLDGPIVDFSTMESIGPALNSYGDLDYSGGIKESFKGMDFGISAGIEQAFKENPILPDWDMSDWNLSSNILGGGIFGGSAGTGPGTTGVAKEEPSTQPIGAGQRPSIGAGQRPSIGFLFPQPWSGSEDNYRYEEPTIFTPLNLGIGIAISAGGIYYLKQNKMI